MGGTTIALLVGAVATGGLFIQQLVTLDGPGALRLGALLTLGILGRWLRPRAGGADPEDGDQRAGNDQRDDDVISSASSVNT